ncbi:hypothetical protein N9850_07805 [Granulosicoccus sp.]|nr:hypothetical protein [Granulosicoccus sp.]MDB4223665.1 hypothetical protein [Granulosicoccus sp.]
MKTLSKCFRYVDWVALGKKRRTSAASPFFSRSYAGYTGAQMETIARHVKHDQMSIFDPMAGQAFGLSSLTWLGHDVWLNDYNPALILFAWLRSRQVMDQFDELKKDYTDWLAEINFENTAETSSKNSTIDFHEGWLAASIQEDLLKYGQKLTSTNLQKLLQNENFSRTDLFKLATVVLAARRLAVFSKSDNVTWLKPGGLLRVKDLKTEILSELEELTQWRIALLAQFGEDLFRKSDSACHLSAVQVNAICPEFAASTDIVICSPPYANRLDYSTMWAPELKILEALGQDGLCSEIKANQVATNIVKGREDLSSKLGDLPDDVIESLEEIRNSTEYASKSYYFPYFAHFCIDLHHAILASVRSAPSAKRWLVFIRDTTRKDTLIESHRIVEHALYVAGLSKTSDSELGIVRNHVGVSRRGYAKQTLHGLVQREWSLCFTTSECKNES